MHDETTLESPPSAAAPILPPPLPRPQPAVWPALVAAGSAISAAALGGGILLVVFLMITDGVNIVEDPERLNSAISSASKDPIGFLVVSLPSQLAFLCAALGAALFSPGSFAATLGYRRSVLPWWTSFLFVLATPAIASVGVFIQRLIFGEDSGQLEMLGQMAQGGGAGFALMPALVLGVLAPVAEETLFRGYVQQRLLARWTPLLAIAVTNVFFLAAHWEPAHIVAILPFSFWLGIVAWRANSVWPAIFCHAAQNLTFVFAHQTEWAESVQNGFTIALPFSLAAFVAAAVVLWRHRSGYSLQSGTPLP